MEIKDVIALAHAGYTAVQIEYLAQMQAQQMQAQQMPQMQAQQMPQMQAQQMPPMQAQQMPQMQAQQMPQMQAQQMPQMQAQQMQAQQMPQMHYSDPVLEQLKALTGAVQNNNIMNSAQPAARSADDVLAAIINPPAADKG